MDEEIIKDFREKFVSAGFSGPYVKFPAKDIESFLLAVVNKVRSDSLKEIKKWAVKEIGYKCAKDDFIYQHIIELLK
jgi:hypothetical protein